MNSSPFLLGVNFPWLRYGEDFGFSPTGHLGVSLPANSALIDEHFARIRDCGASVVRWFLFADGRGGFLTERGLPLRPDEFLFRDVRAVLDLALRHNLQLCFSLLDYLWLQDHPGKPAAHANAQVLQFTAGREAFLHRVLLPLFREFRQHSALFAWEIANEPEWAIKEFHHGANVRMHFADFRVFAAEIAAAIREFAGVPATLGSARLHWVRAWNELGLDIHQAHYYPAQEAPRGGLTKLLASLASLDKPLWLGELPARDDSAAGYSVERCLADCREAGLLGAAVWRWTKPQESGTDTHLGSVEPALLTQWCRASQAQRSSK